MAGQSCNAVCKARYVFHEVMHVGAALYADH